MVNSWTSTKTMSTTCDEEEDGQQLDLRLAPLADFTSTSRHTRSRSQLMIMSE